MQSLRVIRAFAEATRRAACDARNEDAVAFLEILDFLPDFFDNADAFVAQCPSFLHGRYISLANVSVRWHSRRSWRAMLASFYTLL